MKVLLAALCSTIVITTTTSIISTIHVMQMEYLESVPLFAMQQNVWPTIAHVIDCLFRAPTIFLYLDQETR